MAVNATHSTFFIGNSAISFRALQEKFGGSENNVKFSTYKRNTSLNNANPLVPDATENGNIPTSNNNITASQYRGSIKKYILTQTGTDVNLTFHQNAYSASTHHWNSNLGKNVIKIFQLNGTAISSSTSQYALKFNGTGYNLSANISGTVAGFRGTGAAAGSGGNGGNGGDAFYVNNSANTSFNTAQFHARINGVVAGGGGGGGAGRAGNANSTGCNFISFVADGGRSTKYKQRSGTVCRSARCPGTSTSSGIGGNLYSTGNCRKGGTQGSERERRRRRRGGWDGWGRDNRNRDRKKVKGRGCSRRANVNDCLKNAKRDCYYTHNYRVSANGGFGGAGGDGYGSDGSSIRTKNNGNPGSLGNTTNCSSVVSGVPGSTTGQAGSSGGNGGKKGQAGGAGSNSGGNPGRSITSSRISFNGTFGTNIFGPVSVS